MRTLPFVPFVPVWCTLQNRYRSQATGAHIQQPNSEPPSRIERWGLHLQPYNFTVVYKPGTSNIADYLSRHFFLAQPVREWKIAEQYVNYLVDNAVPKATSLDEISNAFEADPTMRKLSQAISDSKWDMKDLDLLQPFYQVRHKLTAAADSNIILRGSRIVIPPSLQNRAVQLAFNFKNPEEWPK